MMDLSSKIDDALILDLSKRVIETASPTGHEGDMARLLFDVFRDCGLDARLQHLYDDRHNVVGVLEGSRPGPTVLLSGHLDTSVTGEEDWLEGPGWKNAPLVGDDGWIYGNGIFNMKAAFVSYVAMAEAMKRTGVDLPGRIILAGTVGEIELAPVDEFQGSEYDSGGVGLRFLLEHGVAADYHLLGEPSGLVPLTGMMGAVWVKLTTHGDFIHTAFAGAHVDAVAEAEALWHELGPWRERFAAEHAHDGVPARVTRAAMRGGLPWRGARTPASCSMYLDTRFSPACYPIDAQREIRAAVAEAAERVCSRPVDVDFYMSRPGTALAPDHAAVRVVEQSHESITGEGIDARFAPPFCTDAIDANRYGIPTVVYGPAGRGKHGERVIEQDFRAGVGEGVDLADVKRGASVYGAAVATFLQTPLDEIRAGREPMPSVTDRTLQPRS